MDERTNLQHFGRGLLLLGAGLIIVIPQLIILPQLQNAAGYDRLYVFLRSGGFITFTLIYLQILTRLFWQELRRFESQSALSKFHSWTGKLAFCFLLIHPMIVFFLLTAKYFPYEVRNIFVPFYYLNGDNFLFGMGFGTIAVYFLLISISLALLRNQSWIEKYWYVWYRLNFFIFPVILLHIFFVGSDFKNYAAMKLIVLLYSIIYLSGLVKLVMQTKGRL